MKSKLDVTETQRACRCAGPGFLLARDAGAITASVPDLRVNLTLPGVGHWTQQETPSTVNEALLAFLDGISIGQRAGAALSASATQVTSSISGSFRS